VYFHVTILIVLLVLSTVSVRNLEEEVKKMVSKLEALHLDDCEGIDQSAEDIGSACKSGPYVCDGSKRTCKIIWDSGSPDCSKEWCDDICESVYGDWCRSSGL
jgi:hypothetical protein